MPKIGATVSRVGGKFATQKAAPTPPPKKVQPKPIAKAPAKVPTKAPPKPVLKGKVKRAFRDEGDLLQQQIERLADAADREAIRAQDLLRFPAFLARQGIKAEEVSHITAQQADQLNRERTTALLTKWNGSKVL